jgi:hypothetical protein
MWQKILNSRVNLGEQNYYSYWRTKQRITMSGVTRFTQHRMCSKELSKFRNSLLPKKRPSFHPLTTTYSLNSPFTTHPSEGLVFYSHNPGFLPPKSGLSTGNFYKLCPNHL